MRTQKQSIHFHIPVKRKITEPDGIYFITFTCYQWLSLIELTNAYDLVYKWFDYLKSWGHYINGYVIMPNHIHALMAFRNTGKLINSIVGNGKRFIAYEIINRLKQQQQFKLLHQLEVAVESKDRERNKKHEVWEDSFDWKECRTHKFMEQKLDYMHRNPCRGKWNLVEAPADYEHSSARFYICGEHAAYPVTSHLELDADKTLYDLTASWASGHFYVTRVSGAQTRLGNSKFEDSAGRKSADQVNEGFKKEGFFAPYKSATTLAELETPADIGGIVRLSGPNSKVQGGWFTTADEIKGLTPEQIKSKLTLKEVPTEVTPVTIPKGTKVRVGTASPVPEFKGEGGGFQIEVLQKDAKIQYGQTTTINKTQ